MALGQLDLHVGAGDAIAHDLEVRLMGAADGHGAPWGISTYFLESVGRMEATMSVVGSSSAIRAGGCREKLSHLSP